MITVYFQVALNFKVENDWWSGMSIFMVKGKETIIEYYKCTPKVFMTSKNMNNKIGIKIDGNSNDEVNVTKLNFLQMINLMGKII